MSNHISVALLIPEVARSKAIYALQQIAPRIGFTFVEGGDSADLCYCSQEAFSTLATPGKYKGYLLCSPELYHATTPYVWQDDVSYQTNQIVLSPDKFGSADSARDYLALFFSLINVSG